MKHVPLMLAAGMFALAACATTPAPASSGGALQETASLMVSISQHGEGASTEDIADLAAQLDERVAAAPGDPFVLKLAAQARRTLSDYSQERAEREDRGAGPKVVKVLKFSKSGNHRPQIKKVKVLGNQRLAAGGELKRARKRVTSVKKKLAAG